MPAQKTKYAINSGVNFSSFQQTTTEQLDDRMTAAPNTHGSVVVGDELCLACCRGTYPRFVTGHFRRVTCDRLRKRNLPYRI